MRAKLPTIIATLLICLTAPAFACRAPVRHPEPDLRAFDTVVIGIAQEVEGKGGTQRAKVKIVSVIAGRFEAEETTAGGAPTDCGPWGARIASGDVLVVYLLSADTQQTWPYYLGVVEAAHRDPRIAQRYPHLANVDRESFWLPGYDLNQ